MSFFGFGPNNLPVNVLILLFMTIFNPVEYTVNTINEDRFGRPVETYGACHFAGSEEFIIPIM
jgi:hypothetical protein